MISVIVPIYNVEKYVNKCVESIVNQTYTNLEIILVDDGSPDRCPEICDEWAKKDSRIKVIHKKNGGLSDARNAGMKIASGDYVAFVDSDDWVEPDIYSTLINLIDKYNSDIAICDLRMVYDSTSVVDKNSKVYKECVYTSTKALGLLIEDKIRQVVVNKIYKIDIIKNIPFAVGKCHEDEFWSYQVIGNADKIVVTDYIGYNYYQRSGSIMGNTYSIKRLDAIEAKCYRQDYIDNNYPLLSSKSKENLFFTCVYNGQLSLKHLKNEDKKAAFEYIKTTTEKYRLLNFDISGLPFKQKIWFLLSKISFRGVCLIRNAINIGL